MSSSLMRPRPCGTLDDARAVLQTTFGYPDFRAPQRRAVEAVLSGRDALIVLPTGGGKSLCFQVPALVRSGLCIVISPLISLMKDQVEALTRRGVGAAFINSTLSAAEVARRLAQAREGQVRLVYLAPERLEGGRTADRLQSIGVSLLAVDEAHCISEWGHDFRPSYRRLGLLRAKLGQPQTVALTATATPAVRRDIMQQLSLRNAEEVVGGFDRTNLTYHVVPAPHPRDKDAAMVRWLRSAPGASVVYAPTRTLVERTTAVLVRARIRATAYHGGLDDALRQRAQDAFMSDRARVIVATSAFGMGIDKPDVRLVVHHAMPGTLESYYQEAGRAGRDGAHSTCVMLHARRDRLTHEFFLRHAHPDRRIVERVWSVLTAVCSQDRAHWTDPATLTERLMPAIGPQETAAALRLLVSSGACRASPPSPSRVVVRLLATPARIIGELSGARVADRSVLRALWRVAGPPLALGTAIDLDAMPASLGGASSLLPVLERLQAQQFITWTRTGGGVRPDPRFVGWRAPPVDWAALARRREGDFGRLDAVERYARTRHCRRAFVLRYFGEADTRAPCGACDRCLGLAE